MRRYSPSLWRVTGGFGLDDALRADVVQTVWLRLYDKAATIEEPDRLIGWLVRVARNECLSVVRRRSRYIEMDFIEVEPMVAETPNLTLNLERLSTVRGVAEGFMQLDRRCQELLGYGLADPPLSYEEIAEVMDMPIGSIGPTRRRCLDKLRGLVSPATLASLEGGP